MSNECTFARIISEGRRLFFFLPGGGAAPAKAFTVLGKGMKFRLREFARAARRSRDVGTRNIFFTFWLVTWKEKVPKKIENKLVWLIYYTLGAQHRLGHVISG